ncbi:hypothetical protein HDV06_004696 [Boothiomyces sp. JEL0866]|nr:hypothetical protein HDV06_004696 [Boothiomyces sp. JEL0866]
MNDEKVTYELHPSTTEPFMACTAKDYQLIMTKLVQYVEKFLIRGDNSGRWTIKGIIAGDYSSLLSLLVDLALYFECQFPIPTDVKLAVTCNTIVNGAKISKTNKFQITEAGIDFTEDIPADQKDVGEIFEELIENAEKLYELLLEFVNRILQDFRMVVESIQELADGGKLILLIGSIGGFYVPLSKFFLDPSEEQKQVNVELAIELLKSMGINTKRIEIKDVLEGDPKTLSRIV